MKIIILLIFIASLSLFSARPVRAEITKPGECPPYCAHDPINGNCCKGSPLRFASLCGRWNDCDKTYCNPDRDYDYIWATDRNVCVANEQKPVKLCLEGGSCETAIGQVPVDNIANLASFLLKYAIFASGGIILIMLIITGYTVLTSSGNPEKLQGAKENITAVFSGFILIIFSLVLLRAVGVDILKIPGL